MKLPSWVFTVPYVEGGRTKKGVDCWGLCVLLYDEVLSISIPSYGNVYYQDMSNYEDTVDSIAEIKAAQDMFEVVDVPTEGDLVLCTYRGQPLHIGFIVDENTMIHASPKNGVVIENFRGLKWQNKIIGYYRYKK